jgi:hypothetical protein
MASPAAGPPPESRHRIKVRILVVLASVFAFLAIFTAWVDRQALDTDQWVDTSGEMLGDPVISDAIADYAVEQLYSNIDVAKLLEKQLPDDVKKLSGPVAGAARQLATTGAEKALQTDRVQGLWKDANRAAHSQLVLILEGESDTVTTREGKVVLDLRPIITQIAGQIGLEKQVEDRLPPDVGELEVADADQLQLARTIARAIDGLALLFTLGSIGLFALAAWLAKGWRWMVVLGYGLGLVAAGLAALATQNVASGIVVDELAKTEAVREPAEHAWTIGTSLLAGIAKGVIAYGVLFVIASFFASPADSAQRVRQAIAPTMRDRRGVVWGVFGAAVFIYLISVPPTSMRSLLLTLALIALAGGGLEALMRKTAHEFPDARKGEWRVSFQQRVKQAGQAAGERASSALRELTSDREPDDAHLDRLERLGELRAKKVLTEAEFKAEKKRLLGSVQ